MSAFIDRLISSARFILPMWRFLVPALVGAFIVVPNKSFRNSLSERGAQVLFVLIMVLWPLLIPWAVLWIAIDGMQKSGPLWAAIPNFAVFFLWPVLAYRFIDKMDQVKGWAIFYVLCNLPGWFFCFITAGMAVGGDWA